MWSVLSKHIILRSKILEFLFVTNGGHQTNQMKKKKKKTMLSTSWRKITMTIMMMIIIVTAWSIIFVIFDYQRLLFLLWANKIIDLHFKSSEIWDLPISYKLPKAFAESITTKRYHDNFKHMNMSKHSQIRD